MASLVQRPDSSTYYIQFYLSGKLKRKSTGTESLQIAKEKLRQFESAQARGDALPLPTRTAIFNWAMTQHGSEATGMDLKHSELLRAFLVAVEHAMPELVREAQGIGPLRRHKNDRGREAEREELERRIARAFLAGMRAAGMMAECLQTGRPRGTGQAAWGDGEARSTDEAG